MMKYTKKHAISGLREKMPKLEVLPNQFKNYKITIVIPEYTSLCPRTGLPDDGTITIEYEPDNYFVELKSLKYYILAYRNLGIFYENAVNRILKDFVKAVKPQWAIVRGEFNPRGGIKSIVEAKFSTVHPVRKS
ncbi:MAG: NADPH-dependent 7-cyano-7-deazaguanine reductase QueF [Candidatus Stahlbacteria bacterium]|nr:NADPH-dependent 7-cyano-7-deazaguanine reductase QueF [candidate division WOR-3 bacterium]NOR17145.1 NADPH-dependent 7-cyano-7-deazaguanine reductase QueF [candidate division WOR-3 bacterium]TET59311.1 MAG: NADPH-dependent 7-cyano-7-deazaguanine reductase QueF [Candidatus Stahlbacteria bacterium]